MDTLWLRVRAPFAAFRWLQAGVYRSTSPVIPPSAAWGMLLNFAAIDTRSPEARATTQVRADAPSLRIAVGTVTGGEVTTLYQQLHGYPVGNSGAELAARSQGAKYWIVPVRREFLVDFDCMLGVQASGPVAQRIRAGLAGGLQSERYGLPFAGDNSFLLEDAQLLEQPTACRWFVPVQPGDAPQRGSARLTVTIDRDDSSRTSTCLFAPTAADVALPPLSAWTTVGPLAGADLSSHG